MRPVAHYLRTAKSAHARVAFEGSTFGKPFQKGLIGVLIKSDSFGRCDPTLSLKDKDGNIPKDLTTVSVGTSGPGHNAWMMTSSALVLFMTLPGLAFFYGGLV